MAWDFGSTVTVCAVQTSWPLVLLLLALIFLGGALARHIEGRRRAADIAAMPLPDRPGGDGQWQVLDADLRAIRKSIRRHRDKLAR